MQDPRASWDGRYGEAAFAYGREPNDFLREVAARIPPGPVLCLAEGEGRNAVFLAERGHDVMAVDLSAVGLEREVHEGPYHEGRSAVVRAVARRA